MGLRACSTRLLLPGSKIAGAAITLELPGADSVRAIIVYVPNGVVPIDRPHGDFPAGIGGITARGAAATVVDGPVTDLDEPTALRPPT